MPQNNSLQKDELKIESPEDLKKVIILKSGALMDIDEWTKIPYPGTSKTEDIPCEIITPKQIENGTE